MTHHHLPPVSRTTLGDAASAALARSGWVCFERASAPRRGAALAALCEMTEQCRDWDSHWDRCPWLLVGTWKRSVRWPAATS